MAQHSLEWQDTFPNACRGGAVAVGNFDGVHRGHAALVVEVKRRARDLRGPAVAVTFDPHPLELLRPASLQPLLTTVADRIRLLHELGADHVVVLHTTPSLLGLSAAEFFERVVRDRLAARAVVEGVNFRFGRDRTGDVKLLAGLCAAAGLGFTVLPAVRVGSAEVSSSRIRAALLGGDVEEAATLCARPHRLVGSVRAGAGRGRTIGFPTANLDRLQTLAPGDGVYAVRVPVGGATFPGAANVGPNPTFGDMARKVEVHLIGFTGDLYDQTLAVDFIKRLRDTRPFASAAELVDQLRRDVEQARDAVESPRAT
jgi:riboflavin kinase/FMN adenylyltransferase